nr:WAT1-related protein At1g25270-like isoform X1 [Setaria viridis]
MASSPTTVREVASEGVAAPTAPEAARQGEVKRSSPTAWETAMLPLSMVAVQVIVVGMLLLSKLTLGAGMSPFVILVYRNMIAAAAVAPLAVYFEREIWKEINWSVCCWIFANAAFGDVLAMGLYFYGLRTTSAAYSSIFLNLIPIATFVTAIVLRAENLALGQWPGKMKLLGALLCVGGTMLVSLLKGPPLHLWPTNLLGYSQAPAANATGAHHNMVVGTLWLCGSCMSYALYFIVQERLVKVFPSTYWMTSLTSLVGSIQALVVGVFLVRDRAEWKLHWNLELLTVVYSGVLNTGLAFLLLSWVIRRSGPIYPTMFNSVCLVMTTVLDSVLLGTQIYLGSHNRGGNVCVPLGQGYRAQARRDGEGITDPGGVAGPAERWTRSRIIPVVFAACHG